MVDVDRRITALTPAHAAGLRRLSTRAATAPSTAPSRDGLLPLSPLAESLLSHLRSSGVPILPGLSDTELARAEAELGFPLPPDLRAVLSLGLPSGPGFPDWRRLSQTLDLPLAAASLQAARGALWPRSWGPRPSDSSQALPAARSALRRSPPLIPLFGRCYLPARPSLAGNAVFLVSDDQISCCALDLADFFRRALALPASSPDLSLRRQRSAGPPEKPLPAPSSRRSLDSIAGKTPRWIEFWSDAASDCRRRSSSSSSEPSPQCFLEIRPARVPNWVGGYLDRISSILKAGGWDESDVSEMVHVFPSGIFDGGDVIVLDDQAIRDALLLKADRCSDSLRRAGWSSDEVHDALSLDFRRERVRRPPVKLPPGIATKLEKLAEAVSR